MRGHREVLKLGVFGEGILLFDRDTAILLQKASWRSVTVPLPVIVLDNS